MAEQGRGDLTSGSTTWMADERSVTCMDRPSSRSQHCPVPRVAYVSLWASLPTTPQAAKAAGLDPELGAPVTRKPKTAILNFVRCGAAAVAAAAAACCCCCCYHAAVAPCLATGAAGAYVRERLQRPPLPNVIGQKPNLTACLLLLQASQQPQLLATSPAIQPTPTLTLYPPTPSACPSALPSSYHTEVVAVTVFHFVKLRHNVTVFTRDDQFHMGDVMHPYFWKGFRLVGCAAVCLR